MRAPPQLSGLEPFGDKTLNRPSVHKNTAGARRFAGLRVTLCDVHALNAKRLHQPGPASAVRRCGDLAARIPGQGHQAGFHKPRHHPGVRATARHGGAPARICGLLIAHRLAQRVIGAGGVVFGVKIEARPWLNHGVDIGHADFAAELHQIKRRGIDAQVHAKPFARFQNLAQHLTVILRRQRHGMTGNAPRRQFLLPRLTRLNHRKRRVVIVKVALNQGQRPPTNRPKTDHHNGAINTGINWVRHRAAPCLVRFEINRAWPKENGLGQCHRRTRQPVRAS